MLPMDSMVCTVSLSREHINFIVIKQHFPLISRINEFHHNPSCNHTFHSIYQSDYLILHRCCLSEMFMYHSAELLRWYYSLTLTLELVLITMGHCYQNQFQNHFHHHHDFHYYCCARMYFLFSDLLCLVATLCISNSPWITLPNFILLSKDIIHQTI